MPDAPDARPEPPGACSLLRQDCPGTQACYRAADGGRFCAAAGTRAVGAACNVDVQCARGLVCAVDASGDAFACRRVCDPAAPACSSGERCNPLAPGVGACQP